MKKSLIIIAGLFLTLSLNTSAHESEGPGIIIIHMDKEGFTPSSLSLRAGDTVMFENIGTLDRWPASNIHPTHGIYPEFDPKKPIKPGGSWQFKFTKSGEWRFHDHIYPDQTGLITVTEELTQKAEDNRVSWIKKAILSFLGYIWDFVFDRGEKIDDMAINEIAGDEALLSKYIKTKGIAEAMAGLIKESGGGSSFDCHQQAHNIGRIGYGVEGEDVFRQCNASCHSGCYHGAMESFLNKNGTTDIAVNIDRICKKFETSFGIFECLHGVGHGVLAYLDYNLPESLNECQKLGDQWSTSSCYGGIFMENILTGQGLGASEKNHQTSWLNKTDPYFPCNAIEKNYDLLYQCYQMQTSWMLSQVSWDFKKVASYCIDAPDNMSSVCMRSYGRDAAGHTLRDPNKIISLCDNVPDKNAYRDQCLVGALNVIVDFWGEGLKEQASALCRAESKSKNICYGSLIERLSGLFKERGDRLAICDTMETTYRDRCVDLYSN